MRRRSRRVVVRWWAGRGEKVAGDRDEISEAGSMSSSGDAG